MTYDGENRPLSVTSAKGDLTEYVYAADGPRLKRTVSENRHPPSPRRGTLKGLTTIHRVLDVPKESAHCLPVFIN